MGRTAAELEALTALWTRIAAGQIVTDQVSYRAAVRILTDRLARIVRPGEEIQPYVHAMIAQGYRRATAYQVVRAAFAMAAERVVKTGPVPPAVRAAGTPATPRKSTPPHATPASLSPPRAAPLPLVGIPRTDPPRPDAPVEHYRADRLPPHLQPGMTWATVQNGGRVWIDCLPFDANREAPFGTDAHGAPWAPYGRDAKGRFLNYIGSSLGATGRIGRGHFVGEPDEP
ncbi:MAG: hypothetical protein ACYDDA_01575 [Acidiferrobacteraceae bacterium]